MTDVRKTDDAGVKAMETIALPRWWVEQACEQLFSMKQLPSGQLGDWAFLFRGMLKDILARPRSAPVPQCDAEPVARWRHKKRGTSYTEVARGELQAEPSADLCEGDKMIAYRGDDGRVWFRRVEEFEDGRFEHIAAAPARCDAGSVEAIGVREALENFRQYVSIDLSGAGLDETTENLIAQIDIAIAALSHLPVTDEPGREE